MGIWFTEAEVAELLQQLIVDCALPAEKAAEALDTMRIFYNGFRFCEEEKALQYNPTLVFYFLRYLQRECRFFDNRDYFQANEWTIKTAFLTLLCNDIFYIVDSETALERTYADLTMILRPEMRRYRLLDILIEFKYIKLETLGLGGEAVIALGFERVVWQEFAG